MLKNTGMHATRGPIEVCHHGASVASATSGELEDTRVLDRAYPYNSIKVKETLHNQRTPANNRLNHDGGYLAARS